MYSPSQYIESYYELLDDLKSFSNKTNSKLTEETPENYYIDNANFFTKSLIVLICAYLESYLKDISMHLIDHYNKILAANPITENIVKWGLQTNKEFKEKDYVFTPLKIKLKKKDIDEHISGNPFRTNSLFKKLGIELSKSEDFNNSKDKINAIVVKRNKIVHHNDNASDVSLSDINENIDAVIKYIKIIDAEVMKQILV